ncbi:hypothetical protein B9J85_04040 [Vibrio sp. V11_P1A41T118]|nr:hypothetical protein B9J85_04040 [Vibrio sp. V11_P1A41T118]
MFQRCQRPHFQLVDSKRSAFVYFPEIGNDDFREMIMARTILYTYKNEDKTLTFSYEKHHNIQEAVAEAEGIDITDFLKMEQQLEMISDAKAVRN